MPFINENGTIDEYEGALTKCDKCGKIEKTQDESWEIYHFWDYEIFRGRHNLHLGVFCLECTKKMTPWVYVLRDIDELKLFVNKLERAINEKRKQPSKDDRPTENNACECCAGCIKRRT